MSKTSLRNQLLTAAICCLICMQTVLADTDQFTPRFKPTLNVPRISEGIRIDGELNDSPWQEAARADGFAETGPGDQIKPPVESAALIGYTESHLYVALIAYDDPGSIRVSIRDRDHIWNDDYFGVMLDTYGDASWGYELFVNPYGIQGDLRMLPDGTEEMEFDIIWESVGKLTDSGYQVEIAIPFSSLRFPDKPVQTWKANFWRDRQREVRYRFAWAATDRDDPGFLRQFGALTGVESIKSGSSLRVLPVLVGYQSGELTDDDDPGSTFANSDPDGEASMNVRYDLTSTSSLELTVNPDFSQIESDAAQVDVNTTLALDYPERRPFFQEGSNLFRTPYNVVHTRSINDPRMAAKFTGRFNRLAMAYILAHDEHSPVLVPLAERSVVALAGKSTVNILRLEQGFLNDSRVGLLGTSRMFEGGGSGTTAGIDGSIRFKRNYRLSFQALASYTEEFNDPGLVDTTMESGYGQSHFGRRLHTVVFDGETFWGNAGEIRLDRSGRTWNGNLTYREASPGFRADDGFVVRNDERSLVTWNGLVFRPNGEWVQQWQPSFNLGRIWKHGADFNPLEYHEGVRDEWVAVELYLQLKGQTNINMEYLNSRERFSGFLHEGISRFEFNINTTPCELISLGLNGQFGRTIHRRHYREYDSIDEAGDTTHIVEVPDLGNVTDLSGWVDFRPTERFFSATNFAYFKLDHSDSYLADHPDEDRQIYEGYILRNRFNYQFSRELSLRLIVQYNDFGDNFDLEPLLTYRLNPFTVFYVGATGNFHYYDSNDYDTVSASKWVATSRQFFFKAQYLFQM